MAICATCGHDNPEGAWTCASCGQSLSTGSGGGGSGYDYSEPVRDQDYYEAPTIYGTSAPTIPPLGAPRASGDGPNVLKIVLACGLVAVLAIVAAWFFLLRGPGGEEFIGTWRSDDASVGTVRIEKSGRHLEIYFIDAKNEQSVGPFKGDVKGGKLESSLEYAGGDGAKKTAAEAYKTLMGVVFDDFKVTFSVSGSTLEMTLGGDLKQDLNPPADWNKPVEFTKVK